MLKSESTKKALLHCPKCNEEFPAQGRERYKQIVDVVRENQRVVTTIFGGLHHLGRTHYAREAFQSMGKMDQDAILQPGGILTDKQIELLK